MATSKNRKDKSSKKSSSGSIAKSGGTSFPKNEFFANVLTQILKEKEGDGEIVALKSLSRGAVIEAFVAEWADRLMELVDVTFEYAPGGKAPCARLLTFIRPMNSFNASNTESPWRFVEVSAVDLHSTLDFRDLQTRMDDATSQFHGDRLAVWLYPSSAASRFHTIFIRLDEDNELVLVTSSDKDGQMQQIAGRKQVELLGTMMYSDLHISNIEHWLNFVDDYTDEFKAANQSNLQETLQQWGMSGPLDEGRWEVLTQMFFTNERFLQFVMDAGLIHAKKPLMEAQSLAGALVFERGESRQAAIDARLAFDQERERDKKRVLKDIERSVLQSKGARELANRVQQENNALRQKLAAMQRSGGSTEDRGERLRQSFGLLFKPLLATA